MPFLADTEFPWVVVAMVFFAFFRWLMDRIKEATRGPQDPVFEDPEEDEEEQPVGPPPFARESEPPPLSRSPSSPSRLPPPVPSSHPAEEFRRLLETMRSAPQEAETRPSVQAEAETRPSVQAVAPPRLPLPVPAPAAQAPGPRISLPVHFPTTHSAASRRRALVLTPQAIRDGIVLREILGPPAALRGEDIHGS